MAATPMLDDLELAQVQEIESGQRQALAEHGIPALEGDFLQRLGRNGTRLDLRGVLTGSDVRDALEALRKKFRTAEPVSFVADIATATSVEKVLIQEMRVRELAGKPERFEYGFSLREFTPAPVPHEEPPPPPPPPPPPSTTTGTLVVDVTVEGRPDFDFSTITVTVQGTQEDGAQLSRTLTSRSGNSWTEEGLPAGQLAIQAVSSPPAAMSGSTTATVQAGQTAKASIALHPASNLAATFVVTFRFDSAFVEPCMRPVLRQVAERAQQNPDEKLLVVGHTDKVGSASYNQSLSERRARAVFAFLTVGTDAASRTAALAEWNALRLKRPGGELPTVKDNWGVRQYQHILQDLGFYSGPIDGKDTPPTQDAVRAFRCQNGLPPGTTVDDPTWNALITQYLEQDKLAVPAARFFPNCASEIVKWLGCGEEDPVKNVPTAWRPNRRVEMLFVRADRLPCQVPQPVTFDLPAHGAVNSDWCAGPKKAGPRCCFVTPAKDPCPANVPDKFCRRPAEPGSIAVQGSIQRQRPDGTLVPASNQKFVLITRDGEFKAGELSSGEPQPAVTDAKGAFSFPDQRIGVCSLEVVGSTLVRLAEQPNETGRGNTVCKRLQSTTDRLDVVMVAAPVLREIRLPVVGHLMTALRHGDRQVRQCPAAGGGPAFGQATTHTDDEIRSLFQGRADGSVEGVNSIWRQARIRFDVADLVHEVYDNTARDACDVDNTELGALLTLCAYPNVVNVFFVRSFDDPTNTGEAGATVSPEEATAQNLASGGCFAAQRAQPLFLGVPVSKILDTAQEVQVVAHELGHFLNLPHVQTPADRLMLEGTQDGSNRKLTPDEVTVARASRAAALECLPLSLRVTGATQVGGKHSHEFLVVRPLGPAPPGTVTVDAVIADALLDPSVGSLSMTGGNPGANARQRTVSTASVGQVDVVATYTPAGGGLPVSTRASVSVATFILRVEGATATAPGSTTFVASRDPAAVVTVVAQINPEPFCVPTDMVTWVGGDPSPDPLRRTVSRAAAATVTVQATVAGEVRTVTLTVIEVAAVDPTTVAAAGAAGAPASTFLRMGLWDRAFRADGTVFDDGTEVDNFAGADSRAFNVRVNDPSAKNAGSVALNWRTLDQGGANLDVPADQRITLVETPANSGVFVSRGLMLVSDTDDQNQVTHSGLASGPDAGLHRKRGESNHRVRRAGILGDVVLEYPATGAGRLTTKLPVFQRTPSDDRRRVPLQIFVLRTAPGGAGVIPTGPADAIWGVDLRVMRETYARLGIQVDTVVAAGTPPADIVTNAGDRVVLIDPPAGVNPASVTLADEVTISTAHPALADTIRVFFVGGLRSGAGGESFADINTAAGDTRKATAFTIQVTGPYAATHEVGHILTNKRAALNTGHFNPPALPAGNRLRKNQNLMRNDFLGAESVSGSKRLWDAADADGLNQFTSIRGSHYTRNF